MRKRERIMEIKAPNDPEDVYKVSVVEYITSDNMVAIGMNIDGVEYRLTKSIKGLQPGEVVANTKEVDKAEYYLTQLGLATKTGRTRMYGGYTYPIYNYNTGESIAQPIPAPQPVVQPEVQPASQPVPQPVVQKAEEPKKEAKYNYWPIRGVNKAGNVWFFPIKGEWYMLRNHTQADYDSYGFTEDYTLVMMTPKAKEEEEENK